MAAFDGQFNVLRIVILPMNDDQILNPASDIEFASVQKTKVAGA